jgi:hypothetical protein
VSVQLSPVLMLLGKEPTHWCPGCRMLHRINVNAPNEYTGARWTWNSDVNAPTFEPSIHIVGVCHYFIRAGQIQFCADSKHQFAGQSMPLPAIPREDLDFWQDDEPAEDRSAPRREKAPRCPVCRFIASVHSCDGQTCRGPKPAAPAPINRGPGRCLTCGKKRCQKHPLS